MLRYPVRSTFTFLGYPNPPWKKARAAILPVPYDATTSYQSGARFGPEAMLAASRQLEPYDQEFGFEVYKRVGIFTLDEMDPQHDSPRLMLDNVRNAVAGILKEKKFPLLIGGDHSLTLGGVEAAVQAFPKLSVLHLDAHMDFRDEFEGTKYGHGSVMRRAAELVPIVSAGIRSIATEDMEEAKKMNHKNIFHAPEVPVEKILEALSDQVYLTIDVDVFDGSIMPATGTPYPGGLNWYQVTGLIRKLAQHKQIVASDIMEFMPIGTLRWPDFLVAKLAYKVIAYKFFGKKLRENHEARIKNQE